MRSEPSGACHIDRDGKADSGDIDDADGNEGGVADEVTHGDTSLNGSMLH